IDAQHLEPAQGVGPNEMNERWGKLGVIEQGRRREWLLLVHQLSLWINAGIRLAVVGVHDEGHVALHGCTRRSCRAGLRRSAGGCCLGIWPARQAASSVLISIARGGAVRPLSGGNSCEAFLLPLLTSLDSLHDLVQSQVLLRTEEPFHVRSGLARGRIFRALHEHEART